MTQQPVVDMEAAVMRVLVRGSGDVASAVAYRLFEVGCQVVIQEIEHPQYLRRGMAFTDAVFNGKSELQGVLAKRADHNSAPYMLACGRAIPVVVDDIDSAIHEFHPDALIDARMRKRSIPEMQRHHAPLTIGLGPNFIAGDQTHVVIETAWGDHLGELITNGAALPLSGEPRVIGGLGRERCVYAASNGVLNTNVQIGQWLNQGDLVGTINGAEIVAPVNGYVRGVCHDGVLVADGAKLLEMYPGDKNDGCYGLGERPVRIAQGVIQAIGIAGRS